MLTRVPAEFVDDGCSNSLDSVLGFSFRWACRLHDWYYCSRCWPEGAMTHGHKVTGDLYLERFIRASLPLPLKWVGLGYQLVVMVAAFRAYNSCGPEKGERCRHNMPISSSAKTSAVAS